MIYCIVVKKECGETVIFHKQFEITPSQKDIEEFLVSEADCNYSYDYDKYDYFKVILDY